MKADVDMIVGNFKDLDLGDDAGGILSGLKDMVQGWFKF